MKNQLYQALGATFLILVVSTAKAQQNQPNLLPPPPSLSNHGPLKPPAPRERIAGQGMPGDQITKLTTLSGTISKAIANDRFEYNGFLLTTGNKSVTVTYPPHLGEKIYNLAKNGAEATVTGFYQNNPQNVNEFHLVTLQINGTTVTDTPPTQPPVVIAQQQVNLNSTIKELRFTPEKEINGFILSSGEIIAIPPHIAQQLTAQLKTGEKVGVTGFTEPKRQGVVYSQNFVMIRAQTLTLNGQAYLVR